MSMPQAPSAPPSKKQNKPPRKNFPNKALNISRKILERSVIQQYNRIESVQQNNVQLAKRVSELEKELTQRTSELQASRELAFQLQMKINRLQNSNVELSLHSLCEKLASLTEETFMVHEFASRVYSELSLPETSPFPSVPSRKSPSSMLSPVTIAPTEGENRINSRDVTLRPSAKPVEMEFDSLVPTSNHSGVYSTDRKTVVEPLVEEVVMTTPPPRCRRSSPLTGSFSPPSDDDEEYVPVQKPKRKRTVLKKARKKCQIVAIPGVASFTEPKTVNAFDSSRSEPLVVPASAPVPEKNGVLDLEEDKKNEKVGPSKQSRSKRHQSTKRRKRLRLIADDSVFIPISDSMMENTVGKKKDDVKSSDVFSPSIAQKDSAPDGEPVGVPQIPDGRANVLPLNRSSVSQLDRPVSLAAEQSRDSSRPSLRTRRRTDSVSYVFSLKQ